MLLGTGIIFTPILSRIFLKKKMYKHTIVGIIISSISLLLIIFSSVFFDYSRAGSQLFELEAILLMILGVFVMSCCWVYEEWLFTKIETSIFWFSGL